MTGRTFLDTIITAHLNDKRDPSLIYLQALSDLGRLSAAVADASHPERRSDKARIVTAALDLLVSGVALLRTQVDDLSDAIMTEKTLFRPTLIGYASNVLAKPAYLFTPEGMAEAIAENLFLMRHPQDTDPENEDVELMRGHNLISCCLTLIRSEFPEIAEANLILMLGKDPARRVEARRAENAALARSLRESEEAMAKEGHPMFAHDIGKAADIIADLP